VSAVVHGHAHKGAPEGKTSTGIPVYNVAMHVLETHYPDKPPYRIIEVPREKSPAESPHPPRRRAADKEPPAARLGDSVAR
jgi:hypothetical protein